jgi:hypothetical protein
MSLDRFQSKAGLLQFSAESGVTATGTASTVASNLFPGGYQFGASNGIAAASNSSNGGAHFIPYLPRTAGGTVSSDAQVFSTTGVITHDNVGCVAINVSTTGILLSIQQAQFDGQLLTINMVSGTTGSIASVLNTSGIGGTTTAACQVAVATTFASTGGIVLQAQRQGLTATTNVPYVWRRIL